MYRWPCSLSPLRPPSHPGQVKASPSWVRTLLVACAVAVFALGLYNQLSQASRHWPAYAHRDDLKQLDELDKSLVDLANEYGWSHPGVSYDVITGWLNAGPPTISAFEQSRNLIEFQPMLGNGVLGVDRAEAMSLLKRSDFAILTTLPKVGIYPFYRHIAEYWDDLKAWADDNMIVARIVPFSNFTATLYLRPTARISGISGGWITSHGLSLEAARSVLERLPNYPASRPSRLFAPAEDPCRRGNDRCRQKSANSACIVSARRERVRDCDRHLVATVIADRQRQYPA